MSNNSSMDDQGQAPAPKRRRVGLACSSCRIRKSRCNGVRPRCEPCQRLGFECIYELPDTSANLIIPRDIFTALEDKVKLLESTVDQQEKRLTAIESRDQHDRLDRHVVQVAPPSTGPSHASANLVVNLEGSQDRQTGQSMTDGMAITFVDEEDRGFFGPSSNIAFMRHIFRAMSKKATLADGNPSPQSSSNIGLYQANMVNASRPVSANSTPDIAEYSLGEEQTNILPPETERLIQSYFSNTGLLFPYIHKETFLETYEKVKSQGFRITVQRTWLGLLNMILAMAASTTDYTEDAVEHRAEQSDVYYRRARQLCKTQMFRGSTLETGKTP
ncbi:hypothetical protein BFJ69_g7847 [Fusarium oxysporum]|uniref:Zn(2)-C6 fungal-type domain-containing protein n=1 Tax=Fusarium oxysporum TaxID=5507 RepID=A0A420N4L5_FUSOX|nr:hypothetical protein BFJ69_g7847 [Fusarium oxysporum]